MRIHNAASLGFSSRATRDGGSTHDPAIQITPEQLAGAVWATLKRGDELVLVRAIGAQADGSFIGEVFGLDPDVRVARDGLRLGDQLSFVLAHVFACESATEEAPRAPTRSKGDEDMLRQSDRLKEQLLATLTHEARNPLAPITSTIRFLQAKSPQDLKFAVDLLERQANQIKRLVNDLLDLSRVQNGTLQVRKRRVDLAWVLHAAIEDVRHLFEEKRQHFADSYPQQRIELEADSARLAEVVGNLLVNASKYTPSGGHIELIVEREAHAVFIRVKDSGIGIPEGLRHRMFEPFVQGDGGAETAAGLGIGLALVKSIVALHGGTIDVKSEGPGLGSEFTIRLPNSTASAQ